MRTNILLFLKTPTVQFRKEAISFLKQSRLTPLAQYGTIAFEIMLTDEELTLVKDSNLFSSIYNGFIGDNDTENLSSEAREIAASWNLSHTTLPSIERQDNPNQGLSWGSEGFDEPKPYSDLSNDFFLEILQETGIKQAESIILNDTLFSKKRALDSFSKIENSLFEKVKDETKVYHLARLAILYPELEETIVNLPINVVNDLFTRKKVEELEASQEEAVAEESCWKMNGEISVGVVFVESSRTGGPVFSSTERTTLRSEIQTGLNWLASENKTGDLSWIFDYQNVSIDVANGTNTSSEDYWRNPAMQAVAYNGHSFSGDWTGVATYRKDMRVTNDSAHAIVIFVTPYATDWHAYASNSRLTLCKRNNWGGWGINAIDTICAHEVCHLFGAADEYTGSGTPCSSCTTKHGCDQVPNGNCKACAGSGGVPCVMDGNALELCNYTRGQIGWRPKEELLASEGKLTLLRVHDVGSGYGPPGDQLDAEVIVGLTSKPGEAFGFQLRKDSNRAYHKGMLDLLRDSFKNETVIRIEYVRVESNKNSKIIRVINLNERTLITV